MNMLSLKCLKIVKIVIVLLIYRGEDISILVRHKKKYVLHFFKIMYDYTPKFLIAVFNMRFYKTALLIGTITACVSTASLADTMTFTITGSNSMNAHWIWTATPCGGDLGTMSLTRNGSMTSCGSVEGLECENFQLSAIFYPDFNTVYNEAVDWSLYGIVQAAGGTKTYTLSTTPCSGQLAEKLKQLASGKVASYGQKSVIFNRK